jgi:hypothetical protein
MTASRVTETIALIRQDEWRMACLQVVASLRLPDWYIAAGFLRNAIWDVQHGRKIPAPLNDVDVVYFDAMDCTTATEEQIKSELHRLLPEAPWEVRNQARMYLRNGHALYCDTAHAIAHWVETPTCIGIRLQSEGQFQIVAPFGLEENWSCRVTPNPQISPPPVLYNTRIRQKRWQEIWPKLQITWAEEI